MVQGLVCNYLQNLQLQFPAVCLHLAQLEDPSLESIESQLRTAQ